MERTTSSLPAGVRNLALRLGANPDSRLSSVSLTQIGTMRDNPASKAMRFRARQTISLAQPQFEWRASTGPLGLIAVIDALENGQPRLEVRLLGIAPVARIACSWMATKAEIMRYLAELAWAPDAILLNQSLTWETAGGGSFRVSADMAGVRGTVDLKLDENGRIGSVFAPDRPRYERGDFVERPWYGRFSDYRQHQARWLPFEGEVGWVLDETSFVAWKGSLQSWTVS